MDAATGMGALSLAPVVLALILAFWTRDAIFSLLVGCAVGVVIAGGDPATGLATLFQDALGTADFIWVFMMEVAVGVMIAFYLRSGVIGAFSEWASDRIRTRRASTGFAWSLGLAVFFSDYFSPLFSGPIARPLTDRYKVSREMLAYLLDSGASPVATLVPVSAWAVYIAGLIAGHGDIGTAQEGMNVFIRSVPFNLYGMLAVSLAGAVAFGLVPAVGPMGTAERRALEEGKVLRDGATPLTGQEMDDIEAPEDKRPSLILYLAVPALIVLGVALGTFFALGNALILEAFLATVAYQTAALALGGYFDDVAHGVRVALQGIKGVAPALAILALAYCINTISEQLGAQSFIVGATEAWMTAGMVPVATFLTAAMVSFFTGTSWGTYAIMAPFAMPIAMNLSGGEVTTVVLATVGALTGGGLFGDHCSPLSDTTVLSSFGAGADHMDHVNTQIPYALAAGGVAAAIFITIGLVAV